jgi:hypothetical protein
MLNAFEQRIVAVLADRLAARNHLTVFGAGAPTGAPAPGQGRAAVSIGEFTPSGAFRSERVRDTLSPPSSRRVLGLDGTVRVRFEMQPAAAGQAAIDAARGMLLEDMSLAAHALAAPDVATGRAFDTGSDEGFTVLEFVLDRGQGTVVTPNIAVSSELLFHCRVEIWPPVPPEPAGIMGEFSRTIALQPIDQGSAGEHAVPAGQTVTLRVRSIPLLRPGAGGQPPLALSLAVKVLSTAPPASRGTVTSGADGAEPAVRVVPVTAPETAITFQAPALSSGERTEYVALHFATPEGRTGVFIGSIAVKIRGGAA